MASFSPTPKWRWQLDQQQVALCYQQGVNYCSHQTPATLAMYANFTKFATCQDFCQDFTLEHAQLYWTFWHALEPLQYPEQGRFAASVDATACACFMAVQGQKSWHLQVVSQSYQPEIGELVVLTGNTLGLALVIQVAEQSSLVLLLEDLVSLSDKVIRSGQALCLLNNRLEPWRPMPSVHPHTVLKSA